MLGFERAIWISRQPRRINSWSWYSASFFFFFHSLDKIRRKRIGFVELATVTRIQLFRERLSEKLCTRQSQRKYGICAVHCSWHCSCRIYFCCFPLALADIFSFKFLWKTVNSKPPTIPFGVVACTLSHNLFQNSCIRLSLLNAFYVYIKRPCLDP